MVDNTVYIKRLIPNIHQVKIKTMPSCDDIPSSRSRPQFSANFVPYCIFFFFKSINRQIGEYCFVAQKKIHTLQKILSYN